MKVVKVQQELEDMDTDEAAALFLATLEELLDAYSNAGFKCFAKGLFKMKLNNKTSPTRSQLRK
jgi:hypothetical protein